MEAELAALAASGATTLVGLMVSETWVQARDRLARFFARTGDERAVDEELSLSQGELAAAREADDDAAAADIEAAWRTRLRRALQADPAAAEELRSLLAEIASDDGREPRSTVHNTISGGVQHGPVFQGERFFGVTISGSNAASPDGSSGSAH
ncbi:hypothetical protein ACIP79_14900 [Streptomyces sp. NPDC088747]|uniref:hypothetical protein n=1 Tax=Streptomyces sp. NPDC088747 TaxID=3365886 RepID=UPI0038070CE7